MFQRDRDVSSEMLANLPERFPTAEAVGFMTLYSHLERRMSDAALLCLLLELNQTTPWVMTPYHTLSAMSDGLFQWQSVPDIAARLAYVGLVHTRPRQTRVDLAAVRQLLASPPIETEQRLAAINSSLFLWLHAALGDWLAVGMLALLIHGKGVGNAVHQWRAINDHKFSALSCGLLASRSNTSSRGAISKTRCALIDQGLLLPPRQRNGSEWRVNFDQLTDCLNQEVQRWTAAGSPPPPWLAGLRVALGSGSIPEPSASVRSFSAPSASVEANH